MMASLMIEAAGKISCERTSTSGGAGVSVRQ